MLKFILCSISKKAIENQTMTLEKIRPLNEGFVKGTLILTPHGYKPIEAIKDCILDDNGQPKGAYKTITKKTSQYIRLTINNEELCVGREQSLCMPNPEKWYMAEDFLKHEIFSQQTWVSQAVIVDEEIELYQLLVADYRFFVGTSNVLVHNLAANSRLGILKYVELAHPETISIGAMITISVIVHIITDTMDVIDKNCTCTVQELEKKFDALAETKKGTFGISQATFFVSRNINRCESWFSMHSDITTDLFFRCRILEVSSSDVISEYLNIYKKSVIPHKDCDGTCGDNDDEDDFTSDPTLVGNIYVKFLNENTK